MTKSVLSSVVVFSLLCSLRAEAAGSMPPTDAPVAGRLTVGAVTLSERNALTRQREDFVADMPKMVSPLVLAGISGFLVSAATSQFIVSSWVRFQEGSPLWLGDVLAGTAVTTLVFGIGFAVWSAFAANNQLTRRSEIQEKINEIDVRLAEPSVDARTLTAPVTQ